MTTTGSETDLKTADAAISAIEKARSAGDLQMAIALADKVIKADQGAWQVLILRGDLSREAGDQAGASGYYTAAIAAAPAPSTLSPPDAAELERATALQSGSAHHLETALRRAVFAGSSLEGNKTAQDASRSGRAIDILFGRRNIYLQQPEKFYFPELPQREFFDPAEFSWAQGITAAVEDIRREFHAYMQGAGFFEPYVPAQSRSPHVRNTQLTGNTDWGALHLYKDGVRQDAADSFPATLSALEEAIQPKVRGVSPIVLFSRLTPGTRIPPHSGLVNTRLICHLPIITPAPCQLRVGGQTRQWRDGELLIFDDSIEHEAVNASSTDRVVLLFDVWRPELTADERTFIAGLFDTIAKYGAPLS